MRYVRILFVVAMVLATIAGCSSGSGWSDYKPVEDPAIVPDRHPDIEGTITKVDGGEGTVLLRLLVEERPDDRTGSQKDLVTITPDTRVYGEKGGKLHSASVQELRQGAAVSAWYSGAVAESYPRQATAVAIVIAAQR